MIKKGSLMKFVLPLRSDTHLIGRVSIMLLVVAATACGSLAYASTGHKSGVARSARTAESPARDRFGVLTHLSRSAERATARSSSLPVGAVLATSSNGSGLYVSEETALGEPALCLTEVEASGVESRVCGPSKEVGDHGLIGENVTRTPLGTRMRLDMLMPDGTSNVVEIGNRGSEQHSIALQNNVAETELENVESIRYTLPDGTTRTVALLSQGASQQP